MNPYRDWVSSDIQQPNTMGNYRYAAYAALECKLSRKKSLSRIVVREWSFDSMSTEAIKTKLGNELLKFQYSVTLQLAPHYI